MKYYAYRLFLALLRSFVYLKRGVIFLAAQLWRLIALIGRIYRKTIGFRVYKATYHLKKRFAVAELPWKDQVRDVLGKRGTLQVVIFLIALTIMLPHSRLYSKEVDSGVAGRKTVLYAVVGPGTYDVAIEEIVIDPNAGLLTEERAWTEGAVVAPTTKNTEESATKEAQDIAGITAGGGAVAKPTIISGESVAKLAADDIAVGRSDLVDYRVKSGDTIGQIAEDFDIDVVTILWANDLTARSYIRPGDVLKILPTSGVLHEVKRGETVTKIASTYDAEVADIVKFNKLQKDGSDIVVGEQLIVPDGKKQAPKRTYTPTPQRTNAFASVAAPPPSITAPAGSTYIWPTSVRVITQYSNWRHVALDISGSQARGKPIYAVRGGTVTTAQCGWNGGYGCYIKVNHGDGVESLYAHNDQLYVSVGDVVTQGQTIALLGNTGQSTGPHLHFEIRVNGKHVNPLTYIR